MRRRGQEDCENLELAINSEDQSKYPHLLVDEELPCVLLRGIELSILRKLKGLSVIVVAKKEDCWNPSDLVADENPRMFEPSVIEEGIINKRDRNWHDETQSGVLIVKLSERAGRMI